MTEYFDFALSDLVFNLFLNLAKPGGSLSYRKVFFMKEKSVTHVDLLF